MGYNETIFSFIIILKWVLGYARSRVCEDGRLIMIKFIQSIFKIYVKEPILINLFKIGSFCVQ